MLIRVIISKTNSIELGIYIYNTKEMFKVYLSILQWYGFAEFCWANNFGVGLKLIIITMTG